VSVCKVVGPSPKADSMTVDVVCMRYAMSLCYPCAMILIQQDTVVFSRPPLCPFTYLSALFRNFQKDDIPNNDMRPVPDAKQVMTNINRFHEQVW